MRQGIVYVAYGDRARQELGYSLESLQRWSSLPVKVIDECPYPVFHLIGQSPYIGQSRITKTKLIEMSPFDDTLYLDVDTRINGSVEIGFEALNDGFDLVITASQNQEESDYLWHIGSQDREATLNDLGFIALQLQAGVFWFRKNDATRRLFEQWSIEWAKFNDQDQGALLRALYRCPVKVWLLGRVFNGGSVIEHRFGMARG